MRVRRVLSVAGIVAVAVFSICFAFAAPLPAGNQDLRVKVMTRNMDPGVDPMAAAMTSDPTVLQTAFSIMPERARRIAVEIALTKPDLVALQEATIWKIKSFEDTTVLDQLDMLLQYLQAYGQHYKKAVVHTLTDVQLEQIGYTDQDAILVRSDFPPDKLKISRPETHVYDMLMSFAVPFQEEPLTVLRGWESVNVEFRGSRFKFVTTHLESPIPDPEYIDVTQYIQETQAAQLMEELEDAKLPIILAGDFNSDAEQTNNYPSDNTDSFQIIEGYGFTDAWKGLRPNNPGFTWSLYPVEGIDFAPFERIDLVFSNGPRAVSIIRTGLMPQNGFFASDHAGVVAVFDLSNHQRPHYGKIPRYRNRATENPECHMPADRLWDLFQSGFRRH
jgi:endonuclease/exonuclease/phosphatase family metal-dependent hydrolase